MLPCFSKRIFGVECPGCGIQRAMVFLIHGDFTAAFHMYPAIYTLIPLLFFLLADHLFKIKYSNIITIALMGSSVVLILGNYLLKFF
ncbi:MAG: DUF2752 domain-containing protein [Flavobacteriales bacterium]|nr:MAG: DUF2752 domain-containing protein [Flavobacteriales bacterium]